MITLVFCADLHIGNHKRFGGELVAGLNERGRLSVEVLGRVMRRAYDFGASDVFALGDVFDDDRPNPQLTTAVQRTFASAEGDGMRVRVLVGNHDQTSDAPGHHALAPLAPVAHVVDAPVVLRRGRGRQIVEVGLVPFRPLPAAEYIPAAVAALEWGSDNATRLLGIHAGVKDAGTPPWLRDSKDAIDLDALDALASAHGISLIACGNWHDHRVWKTGSGLRVVQVGSLCPTGFDDLSPLHGVVVWRDGDLSFEEVPGPRFAKVCGADEFQEAIDGLRAHKLYVSWTCAPESLAAVSAYAESARHVEHHIAGVEVVADARVVEAQAREAAEAARAAGSLDEALAAFVEAMPLEDGVDRAAVLSRARGYL
jgi:DNA repair exonuclease SbcCD nuclease subunit